MRQYRKLFEVNEKVIDSFEPKKELNKDFWNDKQELNKKVKEDMKNVGEEYYKFLKIDVPIKDMYFTGSLANYNWSDYSDIDLHIIVDYSKLSKDHKLIRDFFLTKKAEWESRHNIKILGYNLDIFAQDTAEKTVPDSGAYSLMKDKWITKPDPDKEVDTEEVEKIVKPLEKKSQKVLKNPTIDKIKDLESEIESLRGDLSKKGEFDTDNLAFKYFRRNQITDELKKTKDELIDKEYTVD